MKRFLILTACFILSLCVASDSFATFYGGRVFLNRNGVVRDTTNVYRVYAEDMEDIDAAINLGTAKVNTLELWIGGVKIINSDGTLTFGAGDGLKTGTTAADTLLFQAYDVDGTAYKTFMTLTANNTPSLAITEPAGSALTIDGADIGVTTAAAGNFSTIGATSQGTGAFTTLDTGQGANELYDMNQNVQTTDNVVFNTISPTDSRLTQGSGTGIVVNETGQVVTQVYKVTVNKAAFSAAAVTQDLTIATLPAKTVIHSVYANITEAFACTAVCTTATLSATLGISAGGVEFLVSFDLDAATGWFGDADAEAGDNLDIAGNTNGGYLSSAGTAVVLRGTSGTGNWGDGAGNTNLSLGSVTFYILYSVLP